MALQGSYVGYLVLLCLSCAAALAILRVGGSWDADTGEVCLLSLGSYVSQGLEGAHYSHLSRRVFN